MKETRLELPREVEYDHCCVPVSGLLEILNLKVKRKRLKWDVSAHVIFFIVIVIWALPLQNLHSSIVGGKQDLFRTNVISVVSPYPVIMNFIPSSVIVPTRAPSSVSPSRSPTVAPSTLNPSVSPTISPTDSPVTVSPTDSPVTVSPTDSPVTVSPTGSPVTSTPTDTSSPTPARILGEVNSNWGPDLVFGEVAGESPKPVCFGIYFFNASLLSRLNAVPSYTAYKEAQTIEYFQTMLLFTLCQPGDASGACLTSTPVNQQQGSQLVGQSVGLYEPSNSCLDQAFDEARPQAETILCDLVLLDKPSSQCFPGFVGTAETETTTISCFNSLVDYLVSQGNVTANTNMQGCGPIVYGEIGRFKTCSYDLDEGWTTYSVDLANAATRLKDVLYVTQTSNYDSATCASNVTSLTWLNQNFRNQVSFLTKYNQLSNIVMVYQIGISNELSGIHSAEFWVYSSKLETRSQDIVLLCISLALLCYVMYDSFGAFFSDTCKGTGGLAFAGHRYIKNASGILILDIVLVVFLILLITTASYLLGQNVNALLSSDDSSCEVLQYVQAQNYKMQLVGVVYLLEIGRVLIYIKVSPFISYTWKSMVNGLIYFMPIFLLFIFMWVFLAIVLSTIISGQPSSSSMYNSISLVLSFVVAPQDTWQGVFLFGTDNEQLVVEIRGSRLHDALLIIYVLGVRKPLLALSIGAFYYGVLFVDAEYNKEIAQKALDRQVLRMQELVTLAHSDEDSSKNTKQGEEFRIYFGKNATDEKTGLWSDKIVSDSWKHFCASPLKRTYQKIKALFNPNVRKERRTQKRFLERQSYPSYQLALTRILNYILAPENKLSDFLSFDQLKAITKANTNERVIEIMALVGAGNVYYLPTMHKYQNEKLRSLYDGDTGNRLSMEAIGVLEKRRGLVGVSDVFETSNNHVYELIDIATTAGETHDYSVYVLKSSFNNLVTEQRHIHKILDNALEGFD